ncbi:hypothetical protein [Nocardia spumae]|uniref:hypothetical protein n=1 Tax=Nocardia spumae TaxID=2887190 RepID=UPI001D14A498|nr:hypothetical protein [Nocardia spumae]
MTLDRATLDARLGEIARHPFRATFHLRAPEVEFVALRGVAVLRRHVPPQLSAANARYRQGPRSDPREREYIVEIICRWVELECARRTEPTVGGPRSR